MKMIRIDKKSDTVIIVIHEIYGINEHMRRVCQSLAAQNFNVICPDLLNGDAPFDYSEEDAAYDHFMKNVGFTNAVYKIQNLLLEIEDDYQKVFVVGYSVGATIAWLCSRDKRVDGVVGYYGSRIRDYIDVSPVCPTMLFFPQEEESFNVGELISTLASQSIEVHQYKGKHGFADTYSTSYNPVSAHEAFNELLDFFLLKV